MSSEVEEEVLLRTLSLVAAARRIVEDYAGRYAPVRTDQLSLLLSRSGCHLEIFPFRSRTVAMSLPRCAGVYPILLNSAAERVDRLFALRHELAHVLAGDLDGVVFLSEEGWTSGAERVADLFALADLVPTWWIQWVQRSAAGEAEAAADLSQAVAEYAEDWPVERLADRVRLRLALFAGFRI